MKNISYFKLSNYCRWNQSENAIRIMNEDQNIDIKHKDGEVFLFAIENNNPTILNSLIKYYEKNQLKGDFESIEYMVAKHKLQQILQDAVNTFTPSKEIQEILEKYLPKEDVDSEQDLSDLEDLLGFDIEETFSQFEEHNTTNNVVISGNNYVLEIH